MKKILLLMAMIIGAISFMSAQMIVDFEDETTGPLTLHVMGCGDWDNDALHEVSETFMIVENPDPSGINTSSLVMEFTRRGTDNGGQPWGGFWANVDPNIDVTNNKYVHVKVWKPRISPLKFKLEGGEAGTLETGSMNEQTVTEGWEDIVFDFTSLTGAYPIIAFMPDFEDPLELTGDMIYYFDDILINDSPDPIAGIGQYVKIDFSMYPNPCNSTLNLYLPDNLSEISVYNILGQEVLMLADVPNGSMQIDVSELEKGIYFVRVVDVDNNFSSQKLFKN